MSSDNSESPWTESLIEFEKAKSTRHGDAWCKENGISYRTMNRYYAQWHEDKSFNPDNIEWGGWNRAFPMAVEAEVYKNLVENYAYKGIPISDNFISETFYNEYKKIHPYTTGKNNFHASKGFGWKSKIRHNVISRKSNKILKECTDDEEIEIFKNTIAKVLENYHPDYVININETPVRVEQQTQYTIAYKGDNTQPIRKYCCPKTIISAICGITLSGRKLPITFLAKGKGQVCQRNLNVHRPNIT